MEITETSFKSSHACTAALSAPTLKQAPADPHLSRRLLDTHGQVWVSLLCGHCSFLLGLGVHKFYLCPLRVCFPVLCKFWQLYGRVNGDLLQEGLCHTRLLHPEPLPLQQATSDLYLHRQHSNPQRLVWLSLWRVSRVCRRFCLNLLSVSGGYGFDSKCDFAPPTILLEKAMAPHSSTLAWKIPWMEEPGR